MATNFRVKIGEIGLLTFILALAFQNGLEYRDSDFKRFIDDDMATSCKNLVNFGPVTLQFMTVVGEPPVVDQHFSYIRMAASLLDTATISIEFCEAISTQFVLPVR